MKIAVVGSGTRLAMDDAIALARAFQPAGDDVPAALAEFEKQSEKMALDPWQLAYDYMTRSGRMTTEERLRQEAPQFMRNMEAGN
jgi:2-polyprenyl-6-methoxyphenol hydroxylase-like FAD-dependent oxidoreductase